MEDDFLKIQEEIIDKIIMKSSDELLAFLGVEIENEIAAESIVRRFKYNLRHIFH